MRLIFWVPLFIPAVLCCQGYLWHQPDQSPSGILARIGPPAGYMRALPDSGTFAYWLQRLPLKPPGSPVYLFDGREKSRQDVHAAVIDIDIGERDLQQCADAVMRLRAEYLYAAGQYSDIRFNFTSGDRVSFSKWIRGYRPLVKNNGVSWRHSAAPDSTYSQFRQYMKQIFIYAGTLSLSKELQRVSNVQQIAIGDVFIQGGFSGHAIIVVDMAVHPASGRKMVILAQSYMPAQSIHILKNKNDPGQSPWYLVGADEHLLTPEWTFKVSDLMRF